MQKPTDNAGDSATSPVSPAETVTVEALGEDPVVVQPSATTLDPDGDGGVRLRSTLDATGVLRYVFEAPADAVVTVEPDQSVAVVGAEGELYAGLAAPVVTAADGAVLRARWTVLDDETVPAVDLTAAAPAAEDVAASPLTVDVHLGREVVSSVEWGDREGGLSLALTPTEWGRASGLAGRDHGWPDVVRLEPSADTTVMKNQFLCHLDGARQKDTWNLEPWRPDISFVGYLLARCNPT